MSLLLLSLPAQSLEAIFAERCAEARGEGGLNKILGGGKEAILSMKLAAEST